MKQSLIVIILFLFSSLTVLGQRNTKYTYKFQLGTNETPASINVDTLPYKNCYVRGQVVRQSISIPFVSIQLKSTDTTILTVADSVGFFNLTLKPGIYKLTASAAGYETVEYPLALNGNFGLSVQLNMVQGQSLTWYVIESTKPLRDKEIEMIKKCVSNHSDAPFNCSKRNLYHVSIEI